MTESSRQWSSGEWLSELLLRRGPDAVRIVQNIARRLSHLDCIKWQGSSQRRGDGATLWPWIVLGEHHLLPPVGFRLDGMVEVPFEWMTTAPFDADEQRAGLAQRLQAIPGVLVPQTSGWPSFGLHALDSDDACERIVDVFRWFIAATHRGPKTIAQLAPAPQVVPSTRPALRALHATIQPAQPAPQVSQPPPAARAPSTPAKPTVPPTVLAAPTEAEGARGFDGEVVRWKLSFLVDDALKSSTYGRYRLGPLRRWLSDGMNLSTASISAIPIKSAAEFERHIAQHPRGTRYAMGLLVLVDNAEKDEIERMCRAVVGETRYFSTMAICGRQPGEPWNISTVIRDESCELSVALERAFESQVVPPLEVPSQQSRARATLATLAGKPAGRPTQALDRMREVADRLNVDEEWLREALWLLSDRRGLVLYGPPGTGKTHMAMAIAELIQPEASYRALVPLHPGYTHAGLLGDETHTGPVRALVDQIGTERRGVVILDDLGRVDASAVLGELAFMMEHRDVPVAVARPFTVPERMLFIGTLSTADGDLDNLDAGLRRRFHFLGLFPGEAPLDGVLRRALAAHQPPLPWVADVLDEANRRLGDRFSAIGPSHFLRKHLDEQGVARIWARSILPLLEVRFRADPTRLRDFDLTHLRGVVESRRPAPSSSPATIRLNTISRAHTSPPPRAVPVSSLDAPRQPASRQV